jgi:hypothetical protein
MKNLYNLPSLILLLAVLMGAVACQNQHTLKPLNLIEQGAPITVMAPADAHAIKRNNFGLAEHYDVLNADSTFSISIFIQTALSPDAKKIKTEMLDELKKRPEFSKIIHEDEQGYMYEAKWDASRINYDFLYAKVQGDKQYLYQANLMGNFTQAQAQAMYDAVKQ